MSWIEFKGPRRKPEQSYISWLMSQSVDHDNLIKLSLVLFIACIVVSLLVKCIVATLAG